jgi:hypothetical protein
MFTNPPSNSRSEERRAKGAESNPESYDSPWPTPSSASQFPIFSSQFSVFNLHTLHQHSKAPLSSSLFALRPSRSAFTLIEVVIGITLLSMITVTLFAIIRGSVQSAA